MPDPRDPSQDLATGIPTDAMSSAVGNSLGVASAAASGGVPASIPQTPAAPVVSDSGTPVAASSLPPSSTVQNVVAPIVNMITGGDAGGTQAGVQAAKGADQGFFGDVAASIQKVASQMNSYFQTGVQVGAATNSNPSSIAGTAQTLGAQKSAAVMTAGQASAEMQGNDELHQAAAAAQLQKDIVAMHMSPNDPTAVKANLAAGQEADQFSSRMADVAKMRSVGFFQNPGEYLLNRIIKLPYAERQIQGNLSDMKDLADFSSAQNEKLKNNSVIDAAMNSIHTTTRAAELYKGALASATAAGMDPLIQANQQKISAYELGVAQQNAATSKAQLAIAQAKLPGELLLQKQQADFYGAAKTAQIEQLNARAAEETAAMQDRLKKNSQDADTLAAVNGTFGYFGQQGKISDVNRLAPSSKDAILRMSGNLQASGGTTIAQGPAEARDLIMRSGIPLNNIPAGQLRTLGAIDNLYQNYASRAQIVTPGQPKPTAEQTKDTIYSAVTSEIANEQNNITSSNKIYTMPTVGGLLGSGGDWVTKNPIVQAMKPLTMNADGTPTNRQLDGDLIMNTAAQLVDAGKLTTSQATQALQDFAKNTLNSIQTAGGFQRFSIPLDAGKFPVMYNQTGMRIGNSQMKVNLMNPADTLNKLRQQLSGMKLSDSASQILMGAPAP